MAHGTVIVGLSEGEWLMLATPGTPVPEAKALYRVLKINGGKVDGVEYDEVRKYDQRGMQRLRFNGKGIIDVNVSLGTPETSEDDDTADAVAGNKKELQAALGLDDETFKALWGADGRPDKEKVGYSVPAFREFGIAQGIIEEKSEDDDTADAE